MGAYTYEITYSGDGSTRKIDEIDDIKDKDGWLIFWNHQDGERLRIKAAEVRKVERVPAS